MEEKSKLTYGEGSLKAAQTQAADFFVKNMQPLHSILKGKVDKKTGLEGTLYSVEEARLAAQKNSMDVYHKDLIMFLCDEVEKLERWREKAFEAHPNIDLDIDT